MKKGPVILLVAKLSNSALYSVQSLGRAEQESEWGELNSGTYSTDQSDCGAAHPCERWAERGWGRLYPELLILGSSSFLIPHLADYSWCT